MIHIAFCPDRTFILGAHLAKQGDEQRPIVPSLCEYPMQHCAGTLPRMGRNRETKIKDWDQVTIRLPEGMRDEINRLAALNDRSANAEIIHRLKQSLSPDDGPWIIAIRTIIQEEFRKALGPK